jgi:hypothetical protein
MPTVYRQYCEQCDADRDTEITYDGFAGAVVTSSKRGGKIIAGHYLAYCDVNDTLVPLPHPIETSALKKQNDTWFNATIHGRLFRITNLICKQCGALNQSPNLCSTQLGCMIGIPLGIFVFVILSHFTGIPRSSLYFQRSSLSQFPT